MHNLRDKEYIAPILLEDLGMRFPTENSKRKRRYGLFKCFCGNEFEARIAHVKNGNTKSCGCIIHVHGLSGHILYKVWSDMMRRCYNPEYKNYIDYGGRGITVCERWHSVENFIEDMYPTFEEGLTLDRINVDGNYEQSNCRWATKFLQAQNTRLLRDNNKSGFRGVSWHKRDNKWVARITVNSKKVHLGYFNTAEDGAIAYNNYVIENDLEHPLNILENENK